MTEGFKILRSNEVYNVACLKCGAEEWYEPENGLEFGCSHCGQKQPWEQVHTPSLELCRAIGQNFLQLCIQYQSLGVFIESIIQAPIGTPDKELRDTWLKLIKQFQEIGEQLKSIGFIMDRVECKGCSIPVPEKKPNVVGFPKGETNDPPGK